MLRYITLHGSPGWFAIPGPTLPPVSRFMSWSWRMAARLPPPCWLPQMVRFPPYGAWPGWKPGSGITNIRRWSVRSPPPVVTRPEEGVSVQASFGQGSAIEEGRLKEIMDDTVRLGQFTRTLGFVAAPPARGGQLFDLRTLLEEQLRSRAAALDAPRFLTKLPELLPVRSDKTLLLQAFDALFFLAHECTSKEDLIAVMHEGIKNRKTGSHNLNADFKVYMFKLYFN